MTIKIYLLMNRVNWKGVKHIAILYFSCLVFTAAATAQEILPRPAQSFDGHIGLTAKESVKDFPDEVTAPEGAPKEVTMVY